MKTIALNRRARRDFESLETFEAGLQLLGPEIKAVRNNRVALQGSFGRLIGKELYLVGAHFSVLEGDPTRSRKLLVSKDELKKLIGRLQERGLTLVPIRLYLKGRWAKIELSLARGKKRHDRRESLKRREAERLIRNWPD